MQQTRNLIKAPTARIGIITSKNVVTTKIGRIAVCGKVIAKTAITIANMITIKDHNLFIRDFS